MKHSYIKLSKLACLLFVIRVGGNAITTHLMVQNSHYYLSADVLYRNSAKT